MPESTSSLRSSLHVADWLFRLLITAGLAVDAYIHAKLASDFDAVHGTISQGNLFRLEAGVAALVALLALVLPRRRLLYLAAVFIAGTALGAVLLYRHVNVGALGPLPNMYEPIWYRDKSVSAIAEAVSFVAATGGLLMTMAAPRQRSAGIHPNENRESQR